MDLQSIISDYLCLPDGQPILHVEQLLPIGKLTLKCKICQLEKPKSDFYYAAKIDRNRSTCKQCKSIESNKRCLPNELNRIPKRSYREVDADSESCSECSTSHLSDFELP